MEPRHDRADGNAQRMRDLPVAELFHIAEHDHFLIRFRNASERREHILVGELLWNGRCEGHGIGDPFQRVVNEW
jgi:hypothetical protein